MDNKKSLTTGEVAKLCDVSIPTIHKWIREGRIDYFKMPGSGKLRIPKEEVFRFMEHHGFPIDRIPTRLSILIIAGPKAYSKKFTSSLKQDKDFDYHVANDIFTAGMAASQVQPNIVFVDITLSEVDAKQVCQLIRSSINNENISMVALAQKFSNSERNKLEKNGFNDFLELPLKVSVLRKKVASLQKREE